MISLTTASVVSININEGSHWGTLKPYLARLFRNDDQLLCLQEVTQPIIKSLQEIDGGKWQYLYDYRSDSQPPHFQHGNLTLAPRSLTLTREKPLRLSFEDQEIRPTLAQFFSIGDNENRFTLANIHGMTYLNGKDNKLNSPDRDRHINAIIARLRNKDRFILTGDFNMLMSAPNLISLEQSLGATNWNRVYADSMTRTREVLTHALKEGWPLQPECDYVISKGLFNRNLRIDRSVENSDHYPVAAEFVIYPESL
jgi:endonuclease/exonuclease/phosphatase family metal-dependent hydrolase